MYLFPDHLWAPQRRGLEETMKLVSDGKHVCYYGPTGSGKTVVAFELMNWAISLGMKSIFYLNRKLLIDQTVKRAKEAGMPIGVRAAGFEDEYDWSAPCQIASADTEWSRVHKRNIWEPFRAHLVIIDELHLQKQDKMKAIMDGHRARGAVSVGMTATPIGVSHMCDELVVSGTLAEYRACKALVPAIVKSIEQPDMSKVKRNATGEYIMDGEKKRIYTQSIVGNVLKYWKEHNPDGRATFLYAPGVPESRWFTEQFMDAGIPWAHIDATDAVLDGKQIKLTRGVWQEILGRMKDGRLRGISNRFKAREGIDLPFAYHALLATPIGSLASYLQTIGRILRYSPETPDHVIVSDFGGCYWQHGSPNHDRDWRSWWNLSEATVSGMHLNNIKERKEPEPIRCPMCGTERLRGSKCVNPECGFEHQKSVREVLMENGQLKTREGHLVRERNRKEKNDTQALWSGLVHGHLRKVKSGKSDGVTFAQMEAWFFRQHHYYPPRTLKMMPKYESDWSNKIHLVGVENLT
jgi:superfamily II DNA or RNA helicase